MKKLTSIMMGILFAAAIAFACNTFAFAAPGHPGGHPGKHPGGHPGHHGHHHGHHWGYGPGVFVGSYSVDDGCYMVRRCHVNRFGERRCRWRQVCE